ncbi:MAG: regulatory protein RecX [Bacteroidota bacterium]
MTEEGKPRRKYYSVEEARKRIEAFCAYQERSHQQVRRKLFLLGMTSTETENILTDLITAGFLSEHLFAKAYAGGKFRMKKWGRTRIEQQLRRQGLSTRCIAVGLKEIDRKDYEKTLRDLLDKKIKTLKGDTQIVIKHKAARFAIAKGYEPDLVWKFLGDPADE